MYFQVNLCCLCLTYVKKEFKNLYECSEDEITYFEKLCMSFPQLVIPEVSTLEDYKLCTKCSVNLDNFYHFYLSCSKSLTTFADYKRKLKLGRPDRKRGQINVNVVKLPETEVKRYQCQKTLDFNENSNHSEYVPSENHDDELFDKNDEFNSNFFGPSGINIVLLSDDDDCQVIDFSDEDTNGPENLENAQTIDFEQVNVLVSNQSLNELKNHLGNEIPILIEDNQIEIDETEFEKNRCGQSSSETEKSECQIVSEGNFHDSDSTCKEIEVISDRTENVNFENRSRNIQMKTDSSEIGNLRRFRKKSRVNLERNSNISEPNRKESSEIESISERNENLDTNVTETEKSQPKNLCDNSEIETLASGVILERNSNVSEPNRKESNSEIESVSERNENLDTNVTETEKSQPKNSCDGSETKTLESRVVLERNSNVSEPNRKESSEIESVSERNENLDTDITETEKSQPKNSCDGSEIETLESRVILERNSNVFEPNRKESSETKSVSERNENLDTNVTETEKSQPKNSCDGSETKTLESRVVLERNSNVSEPNRKESSEIESVSERNENLDTDITETEKSQPKNSCDSSEIETLESRDILERNSNISERNRKESSEIESVSERNENLDTNVTETEKFQSKNLEKNENQSQNDHYDSETDTSDFQDALEENSNDSESTKTDSESVLEQNKSQDVVTPSLKNIGKEKLTEEKKTTENDEMEIEDILTLLNPEKEKSIPQPFDKKKNPLTSESLESIEFSHLPNFNYANDKISSLSQNQIEAITISDSNLEISSLQNQVGESRRVGNEFNFEDFNATTSQNLILEEPSFHIKTEPVNESYLDPLLIDPRIKNEYFENENEDFGYSNFAKDEDSVEFQNTTNDSKFSLDILKAKISDVLMNFKKNDSNVKIYSCKHCDKNFDNKKGLKIHIRMKHSVKNQISEKVGYVETVSQKGKVKITCLKCSKDFSHITRYKMHICAKKINGFYHCKYCPDYFYTLFSYRSHERKKHFSRKKHLIKNEIQHKKDFKTELNSNTLIKDEISENSEQVKNKTVAKNLVFKCELCRRTFKYKRLLSWHLNTHRNRSEIPSLGVTTEHFKYPTKNLEFKCNFCPRTFKYKRQLSCHLKYHQNRSHISLKSDIFKNFEKKNQNVDEIGRLTISKDLLSEKGQLFSSEEGRTSRRSLSSNGRSFSSSGRSFSSNGRSLSSSGRSLSSNRRSLSSLRLSSKDKTSSKKSLDSNKRSGRRLSSSRRSHDSNGKDLSPNGRNLSSNRRSLSSERLSSKEKTSSRRSLDSNRNSLSSSRRSSFSNGRSLSPNGRSSSSNARSSSPNGRSSSPNGRCSSPNGRSSSPNGRSLSPNGRSSSPKGRSSSPKGRSLSSNGRSLSRNGRGSSSNGRSLSSNGRSLSRNGRGSSSNGRSLSSNGRSLPPNGRSYSPNGRSSFPNGRRSTNGRGSSSNRRSSSSNRRSLSSSEDNLPLDERLSSKQSRKVSKICRNNIDENENENLSKNLFSCDICLKSFQNKTHLYFHKLGHKADNSTRVKISRPVENNKRTVCKICSKVYKTRNSLYTHLKVTHGIKVQNQCFECNIQFKNQSQVMEHRWRKHLNYTCEICPLKFYHKTQLQNHMKDHEKSITKLDENKNGNENPPKKSKNFENELNQGDNSEKRSKNSDSENIRIDVPKRSVDNFENAEFSCRFCEKTYPTNQGLRVHENWHVKRHKSFLKQETIKKTKTLAAKKKIISKNQNATTTNQNFEDNLDQNRAKSSNDGLKTSNDGLKISNDGLKISIDGLSTSNDGLKTFKDGLKTSNDRLKTSNDGLKTSNDRLKTSNDGLKTSNDGLKSFKDGLKTSNDGGKTSNYGLKTTNDGLKTFNNGLKKVNDGLNKFNDGLKKSNDQKLDETVSQTSQNLSEYKCEFCDRILPSHHGYILHKKWHYKRKIFSKPIENSTNLKISTLPQFSSEKLDLTEFKCKFCDKIFRSHHGWLLHEKWHIKRKILVQKRLAINNDLSCKYCYKNFSSTRTRNLHEKIHKNEKYYTCTICNDEFSNLDSYISHQMSHNDSDTPLNERVLNPFSQNNSKDKSVPKVYESVPNQLKIVLNRFESDHNWLESVPNRIENAPNQLKIVLNRLESDTNLLKNVPNRKSVLNQLESVPNQLKTDLNELQSVSNRQKSVPFGVKNVLNKKSVRNRFKNIPNEIENQGNLLESVPNDLESVRNDLESVRDDLESVRNDLESVRNKLDSVRNKLKSVPNKLKSVPDLESVRNELGSVWNELGSVRNELESVLNKLVSVPNKLKSVPDLESVRNELKSVQNELESVWNKLKSVPNKLKSVPDLENVRNELKSVQKELESVRDKLESIQNKFDSVRNELESVRNEFESVPNPDGDLTCRYCFRECRNNSGLIRHMTIHKKTKIFDRDPCKCRYCHRYFLGGIIQVTSHERNCHVNNPNFTCRFCLKMFNKRRNLIVHLNMHKKLKIFDRDPHKCQFCSRYFTNLSETGRHERNVHKSNNITYECKICQAVFLFKRLLSEHEKIHKGESPKKLNSNVNRTSINRDDQNFKFDQNVNSNPTVSTKNSLFSCKICSESFSNRRNLLLHKRSLHKSKKNLGDSPKTNSNKIRKYQCEFCSESFNNPRSYSVHKKIHKEQSKKGQKSNSESFGKNLYSTEVERFCCDICPNVFENPRSLFLHRKMHLKKSFDGEKTILNPVGDITESKPKRLSCDVCSKVFEKPHSLFLHKKTHDKRFEGVQKSISESLGEFLGTTDSRSNDFGITERKRFRCDTCSKVFENPRSLFLHKKTHKNDSGGIQKSISETLGEFLDSTDSQKSLLDSNGKNLESIEPSKFSCNDCSKVFENPRSLYLHKKSHENDFEVSNKLVKSILKPIEENLTSTEPKQFSCDTCSKVFDNPRSLFLHKKTHGKGSEGFRKSISESLGEFLGSTDIQKLITNPNGENSGSTDIQKSITDPNGENLGSTDIQKSIMDPNGENLGSTNIQKSITDPNGENLGSTDIQKSIMDPNGENLGSTNIQKSITDPNGENLGSTNIQKSIMDPNGENLGSTDIQKSITDPNGENLGSTDIQKSITDPNGENLRSTDIQKSITNPKSENVGSTDIQKSITDPNGENLGSTDIQKSIMDPNGENLESTELVKFCCDQCPKMFTNHRSLFLHRKTHGSLKKHVETSKLESVGATDLKNSPKRKPGRPKRKSVFNSGGTKKKFKISYSPKNKIEGSKMELEYDSGSKKHIGGSQKPIDEILGSIETSQFSCSICAKVFENPRSLFLHKKTHDKNSDGVRKSISESLGEFLESINNEKSISDPNGKIFKSTEPSQFFCNTCSKVFENPRSLFLHKKSHKKDFEISNRAEKSISKPIEENLTSTEPNHFSCDTCSKVFENPRSLFLHRKTHGKGSEGVGKSISESLGEFLGSTVIQKSITNPNGKNLESTKPSQFSCDTCPKVFENPRSLFLHQKIHKKGSEGAQKSISESLGEFLNSTNSQKSVLDPNGKNLESTEPGPSTSKSGLNHLENSNIKNIDCNLCGTVHTYENDLELLYNCDMCDENFYCFAKAVEHRKTHNETV